MQPKKLRFKINNETALIICRKLWKSATEFNILKTFINLRTVLWQVVNWKNKKQHKLLFPISLWSLVKENEFNKQLLTLFYCSIIKMASNLTLKIFYFNFIIMTIYFFKQ